jgi:uncharacterized protein (TIGR03790 family)
MVKFLRLLVLWPILACGVLHAGEAVERAAIASSQLTADQLGVVINEADPNSVEVGEYYIHARNIPEENVVRVNIPGKPRKIDAEQYAELKAAVEAGLGPHVQAMVLVWTAPYMVACNSITSALTMGFDPAQCRNTCAVGKPSPYYDSKSRQPYSDYRMRLSMLLPTESVAEAKALIQRGIISGFRQEPASAYLLITTDKARNSRAHFFPKPMFIRDAQLMIKPMRANSIEGEKDVMIYLTGLPVVPNLKTLEFRPGALADHLTSFGGDLLGERQMSSLRWLQAGATASYGTVSEPCGHWQKFPHPLIMLKNYLSGLSAIETYWKSVQWPMQGLIIGEPLAAPYRGIKGPLSDESAAH